MADFDRAYAKTARNEGGFSDNPADMGGMTYRGIARKFWPTWAGWRGVDAAIANMVKMPRYGTEECRNWVKHLNSTLAGMPLIQKYVLDFYEANFWKAYSLGEIQNQEVADKVYDRIVNAGANGAKILQRCIGVSDDGVIGNVTLTRVNDMDPSEVLNKFKTESEEFYRGIVERNPSQKVFLASWLNRC